jgi:hypothetical protein
MHEGTNLVRVLISIDGLAPCGALDLEQRPGTQAPFLRPRAYLYRRRLVVAFIEGPLSRTMMMTDNSGSQRCGQRLEPKIGLEFCVADGLALMRVRMEI